MLTGTTETQNLVKVSGRGALVNIEIDDSAPLKDACRALREHLGRNRLLYSGGEVIADIGARLLSDAEQDRIRKVIESESGLSVKQFWCRPEILERESRRITQLIDQQASIVGSLSRGGEPGERPPEVTREPEPIPEAASEPIPAFELPDDEVDESHRMTADIAHGNLRAGETRRFPGHAVILGNVNPGAQVIAAGDVIVFGGLRGQVHAGAGGDTTATILAMSIAYPVLRIADYSWHRDGPAHGNARQSNDGNGPTLARVSSGAIRVGPYLKTNSMHQGGDPNER